MIIIIETVILCIAFFLICFWGTGTDNKNLKAIHLIQMKCKIE